MEQHHTPLRIPHPRNSRVMHDPHLVERVKKVKLYRAIEAEEVRVA